MCPHAVQKRLTPAVYDFVINVLQPAEEEGHAAAAPGRLKKEERTVPDIIFQVSAKARCTKCDWGLARVAEALRIDVSAWGTWGAGRGAGEAPDPDHSLRCAGSPFPTGVTL